jgi:hypothetical protein
VLLILKRKKVFIYPGSVAKVAVAYGLLEKAVETFGKLNIFH